MRRVFIYLLVAFVAGQVVALAVGNLFIQQQLSVVQNPNDASNALTLLLYVLVAALVLLLVLKYYAGSLLFQAVEFMLVFFTVQLVAGSFLDALPTLALSAIVAAARFAFPPLRLYVLTYSSAVAGALLGASLGIFPALAFAVLLAAYDYWAVFHTKHMITMAQGLDQRGVSFSLKITSGASQATGQAQTAAASNAHREQKHSGKGKRAAKGESVELGTGDLVIPAMIAVSALKLSMLFAIGAFGGSLLGVLLLLWVLSTRKGYFPALPPLVAGTLFGLGTAYALQYLALAH